MSRSILKQLSLKTNIKPRELCDRIDSIKINKRQSSKLFRQLSKKSLND